MGTFRFVSECIGEEYKKWTPDDNIIISFPTGRGKTFFVLHVLVPYAKKLNKKVFYFCNRVALFRQIEKEIREDITEYITPIMYQSAEQFMSSATSQDALFYVFDEGHYMFNDATFNPSTNEWSTLFYSGIKNFKSTCIFMSATPDDIYMLLANKHALGFNINDYIAHYGKLMAVFNKDKDNELYHFFKHYASKNDYYISYKGESPYSYGDWWYENVISHKDELAAVYAEDVDYSYLDCYYFTRYDELTNRILNSEDSKWLIFVSSIKEGEQLETALNQRLNEFPYNAVFITSKSKDSKHADGAEFNNIVNKSKFNCKVLIATSVIDNGVNIKDELLTNIVISAYDKTSFIQMLGRKRITDTDQKVNLYIRYINHTTFLGLKSKTERGIDFLMKFHDANSIKYIQKHQITYSFDYTTYRHHDKNYIQKDLSKEIRKYDYINLLSLNRDALKDVRDNDISKYNVFRDYKINLMALIKLVQLRHFYKYVLDAIKEDKLAFLKMILCWLGKTYDYSKFVDYDKKIKLLSDTNEYLKKKCGKYLNKWEQTELRETLFKALYEFDENAFGKNRSRFKIGTNKLPGQIRLNEALKQYEFNFAIRSNNLKKITYWVIYKR